jgi:hypothetical protein
MKTLIAAVILGVGSVVPVIMSAPAQANPCNSNGTDAPGNMPGACQNCLQRLSLSGLGNTCFVPITAPPPLPVQSPGTPGDCQSINTPMNHYSYIECCEDTRAMGKPQC